MNTYAVQLVSNTGKLACWRGEAICLMDALVLARNVDFPEHVHSWADVAVVQP